MSTITTAPPAAPLSLTDTAAKLFAKRESANMPCILAVPGAANFELHLFNVNATGKVKPSGPGALTITLYARAGIPEGATTADATTDPTGWLPLASAQAESIGGAGELAETAWMIRGTDLLYNLSSGKMQGTFKSNVADDPLPEADLEEHLEGIINQDPVIVFAIGATCDVPAELRVFEMTD
jgi:hypothetical protein